MATIPLPGYDDFREESAKELLICAKASLAHPRKVQAEAGLSALCLLYTKVAKRLEAPGHIARCRDEVKILSELQDQLSDHIFASEKDLAGSIEEKPLHGLLAAFRYVDDPMPLHS